MIDWCRAYVPTYIPDEYEVNTVSDGKLLKTIEFKNPQGSFITYTELSEGTKPALDTENASVFEAVSGMKERWWRKTLWLPSFGPWMTACS